MLEMAGGSCVLYTRRKHCDGGQRHFVRPDLVLAEVRLKEVFRGQVGLYHTRGFVLYNRLTRRRLLINADDFNFSRLSLFSIVSYQDEFIIDVFPYVSFGWLSAATFLDVFWTDRLSDPIYRSRRIWYVRLLRQPVV